MANLRNINLNLILAFDALMAEEHVGRAGAKIGLSQPGMSYSLKQLRRIFDDQLFIKSPGGVLPTQKALNIYKEIEPVLNQISSTIDQAQSINFDPKQSTFCYKIALSEYTTAVCSPVIEPILRECSPLSSFTIVTHEENKLAVRMEQAQFSIHTYLNMPNDKYCTKLYEEELVLLYDADKLKLPKKMTIEQLCEFRHVIIDYRGDAPTYVSNYLKQRNMSRRIVLTTPFVLTVGRLLKSSDLVCLTPRRCAEDLAEPYGLSISTIPLALPKQIIVLSLNALHESIPEVKWLVNKLIDYFL